MVLKVEPETKDTLPETPLGQILAKAQAEKFDIATVAYTAETIAERQVKFALISTVMYLYYRYNDTIYRVALT